MEITMEVRIMLDGCYETTQCGARWSMAAIDDSIGGDGLSEQEAWTVRRAAIGEDRPGVVIGPTQWPLKTTRSGRQRARLERASITTTVM
jgi:hypothetical protein